jgi:hypothetical protein
MSKSDKIPSLKEAYEEVLEQVFKARDVEFEAETKYEFAKAMRESLEHKARFLDDEINQRKDAEVVRQLRRERADKESLEKTRDGLGEEVWWKGDS